MVLSLLPGAATKTVPAVIVPDEPSWAVWGHDLRALGFAPAAAPSQASVLVGPSRVPEALAAAVAGAWRSMPAPRLVTPGDPVAGSTPLSTVTHLADEHGLHDGHGSDAEEEMSHGDMDHGDMDHHDMMVIVGDPSEDGLVMEAVDFELGPLSSVLPGGLVAALSLDGDVVAACELRALLTSESGDPLAPAASSAAAGRLVGLAAVEVERAVSHLAWLRRFAEILGWPVLADRAGAPLRELIAAAGAGLHATAPDSDRLGAARAPLKRLVGFLDGNRWLRARTAGLAVVDAEREGLMGPNARAAGVRRDARTEDPRYRTLGFEPVVREAGDAEARVLVRADEALAALGLAEAALRTAGDARPPVRAAADPPPARAAADPPTARTAADPPPARATLASPVEGPRGPLPGDAGDAGHAAALRVAAACAAGLEWSDAATALASFDLSAWRVAW